MPQPQPLPAVLAPATDAPRGTVSFFTRTACPDTWMPATYAVGRLIVATTSAEAVSVLVGSPLGSAEDREHSHEFAGMNVHLPFTDLRPGSVTQSRKGNMAGSGTFVVGVGEPSDVQVSKATSNLPFTQLIICEKQ